MPQHPNARLTPRGRAVLCERVGGGMRIADAAAMAGVSRQTAHKWLALSAETGVPARAYARIVARRGLPRLDDIDRVTGEPRARGPVRRMRHEREHPGELVHVDVKKVPRIPEGGGHRALGRGCGSRRGAGTSCLLVVDDNSRVAYAEQLPDREEGDNLRPHGAGTHVLRGPRGRRGTRDDRQRTGLSVGRVQRAARGPRDRAQVHGALQPLAERQSRAHEQDARARVAVRPRLGERGCQGLGPGILHRVLQLGPSAQRVRGPAPDVTHSRRKQRLGT